MIAPWWYWRIAAGVAATMFPLFGFGLYGLLMWGGETTPIVDIAILSVALASVVGTIGILLLPARRRRWSFWCFAISTTMSAWAWNPIGYPIAAWSVGFAGACASLCAWKVWRDPTSKP